MEKAEGKSRNCGKISRKIREKAETLETSVEEAEKVRAECERLRHEHNVLVASEEKLVDKLTEKDEIVKRLMTELSECKSSLEEQSHKLHASHIAVENYKDEESRRVRELEDARSRQKEVQESERQLLMRVRELEMSEAVLTTKLSAMETEKEHSWRVVQD